MVYIGIDVATKQHDIVVVDSTSRLLDHFTVRSAEEAASSICRQYPRACIAVDAPSGLARGLMADPAYLVSLVPAPPPGKYLNCRVCEYEVRRRGISLYFTPTSKPRPWVLAGMELFSALDRRGFRGPPEGLRDGRCLVEYYPYASFVALAGQLPARKSSPAGRAERESLLCSYAVSSELGELSRHQIDALAGSVTALRVADGSAGYVGDPGEGTIWTPTPLKEKYERVSPA